MTIIKRDAGEGGAVLCPSCCRPTSPPPVCAVPVETRAEAAERSDRELRAAARRLAAHPSAPSTPEQRRAAFDGLSDAPAWAKLPAAVHASARRLTAPTLPLSELDPDERAGLARSYLARVA